jgi:hypothetical protein
VHNRHLAWLSRRFGWPDLELQCLCCSLCSGTLSLLENFIVYAIPRPEQTDSGHPSILNALFSKARHDLPDRGFARTSTTKIASRHRGPVLHPSATKPASRTSIVSTTVSHYPPTTPKSTTQPTRRSARLPDGLESTPREAPRTDGRTYRRVPAWPFHARSRKSPLQ